MSAGITADPLTVQDLRATVREFLGHLRTLNEFKNGRSHGKSFRSQDGTVGKARTTRGADPFSNRAVQHGSSIRSRNAIDEATALGGRSLLQPVSGSNFNAPGSRDWDTRVAVPTRGPDVEGRPIVWT
jgi:hypothetical protein